MVLSQVQFESLLCKLREQQTESSTNEGKSDLHFDTQGDNAYFIRHVAALANNVEPSYLIIGLEDGTWNPIGLPDNSPLHDVDRTQQQMNQVLGRGRLDPSLSIHYCTYQVDGVTCGCVSIEGTHAPYIIGIEDQSYGGARTRGRAEYIYRGAIYVRHGANSIIVNRQSRITEIIRNAQEMIPKPDDFLTTHNYLDVESSTFGHHRLTKRLEELHPQNEGLPWPSSPARSWVSLVFYPSGGSCVIDTVALKDKLTVSERIGRGAEWYRDIPLQYRTMLNHTDQSSVQEFKCSEPIQGSQGLSAFIQILHSGHIEIGCTYPLFVEYQNRRYFTLGCTIGYLWQTMYFCKAIYEDVGYLGEVAALLNLAGTENTFLDDFATGWRSPDKRRGGLPRTEIYQGLNIQVERRLHLAISAVGNIEASVREIAFDLASYYGQDSPRCFDRQTGEFPHRDYLRRYCRPQ